MDTKILLENGTNELEILEFTLAGNSYGINVAKIREIIPYIDMVDLILVMTVHPGFGGQSYLTGSIDRIKMVRDMINGQKRDIRLEIDGGIYLNNLKMNLEAGADVIVAGSAVFEGDIEKNIKRFMELLI